MSAGPAVVIRGWDSSDAASAGIGVAADQPPVPERPRDHSLMILGRRGHRSEEAAMLVTILVNNYNYAPFLRESIESALNQTYPHIEVIAVDDGSTDGSREIIASYGERLIPVFKENGGQASAINAGFRVSRGDIICILDSDDMLLPKKVAETVDVWREHPNYCLVYHQLQRVGLRKEKIGRPYPRSVWRGDIRARVERAGGWWPYPGDCALSFSRSYMERMMPMPTGSPRAYPDTYLAAPAPYFGPIYGIREPLALYRMHGQNYSTKTYGFYTEFSDAQAKPRPMIDVYRQRLNQYAAEFEMRKEAIRNRLGVATSISLEDHLRYQMYRRAVGEPVSLAKLVRLTLKSPVLPLPMKWREAVKIALNKSF
jgi:glycosyltransferase involved in cell wall biosynthesis